MKHVVFCLPGKSFTEGFFDSWNALRSAVAERGDIRMTIARGSGPSVVHVRNHILENGVDGLMRIAQPFGGMSYDYMMWIDSDSVFTPDAVFKLLEADKDIVTGLVPIDLKGTGAMGYVNNFSPTKLYNLYAIPGDQQELIEIDFCGFGFVLVKHGVFESMEYPWFQLRTHDVGQRIVYLGEDFTWCARARELGWKIYAHPQVRIGHEKIVNIQVC